MDTTRVRAHHLQPRSREPAAGVAGRLAPIPTSGFQRRFIGCGTAHGSATCGGMLGGMTESTGPQGSPSSEPTNVAETPSRWGTPHRRNRIFTLAASVVIVAGIVFIFAVVFWTGLMIGAHGGGHEHEGHHRGHEGRGSEQSEMNEHGSPSAPASVTATTPAPSPARP
jgi:hypothetical protein